MQIDITLFEEKRQGVFIKAGTSIRIITCFYFSQGRGYVEVDTAQEHNKNAVILKSDGTTLYLTR